ncbi:hypothetical protein AWB75_02166 [Caballeronia catudaia]|uniref:Uncharacterized protein n=1 Tax=Caballeronia catudaia TaxID=1777136 RepID=A0A158AH18_9BURK|nr:hypothetical protein AWB75_02166 [Caballeronia catudaia]
MLSVQLFLVLGEYRIEFREIRLGQLRGRLFQQDRLQQPTQCEQFTDFSDGQLGYDSALMRNDPNQSFPFELNERFPHGNATHAELGSERILSKLETLGQLAREDLAA